ncbi:GNAT family N-acetyltransferase [Actinoplanes solisilvae]|uniref:GNAT family N-acetyltransferase n=1 Tax=Actinoplanes solisilvae TaxID=2486853 RepID=UPI00196B4898|nr:GNAT family N-acetyltransferase [Actinoplanes solisilvae]
MALVIPTADLSVTRRGDIRALLDAAFAGGFDDDDWDHCLGGLHFLVEERGALIAHASVVQRGFFHRDRAWRCGYVEAVAVHPAWRGQGFAAAVLDAAESVVDRAYDLGALSASESGRGLYVSRGWLPWQGRTAVLAPTGLTPTPEDDDSTYVRFVPGGPSFDRDGTLACDWRNGDVW